MADHAGKKATHNSSHKPSRNFIGWADRKRPREGFVLLTKNTKPRKIS